MGNVVSSGVLGDLKLFVPADLTMHQRESESLPQQLRKLPARGKISKRKTRFAAENNAKLAGAYKETGFMQPPEAFWTDYLAVQGDVKVPMRKFMRAPAKGTEILVSDVRGIVDDWAVREAYWKWASQAQRKAPGIDNEIGTNGPVLRGKWNVPPAPIMKHKNADFNDYWESGKKHVTKELL